MSSGGNLAEVRVKILHFGDFEEMDVRSVGGLSSVQARPASVVKLRRKLVGNFVSKCSLDLSPISYLAAGGPHSLERICLSSQDPYFMSYGQEKPRRVPVRAAAKPARMLPYPLRRRRDGAASP